MPPCTTSSCLPSCHGQEEVDRDCSSRIACAVCTLRALCAGACQFCALIPGCAGIPPGKSSGIQKPHNEPHHQLCGKPSSPGTPGPSGRNRGYAVEKTVAQRFEQTAGSTGNPADNGGAQPVRKKRADRGVWEAKGISQGEEKKALEIAKNLLDTVSPGSKQPV